MCAVWSSTTDDDDVCVSVNAEQLSWDIALDNHSEEALGELVFETLLEIAPSFKNLIGQPKKVVSNSFVEMLQQLVSFAGDEVTMRAKMMGLSQRHHKYHPAPQTPDAAPPRVRRRPESSHPEHILITVLSNVLVMCPRAHKASASELWPEV
eukprot:3358168-Rhodomonas_salina.2